MISRHLKNWLKKIWGFAEFNIVDLPNNYFVVRFTDQQHWREHYKKVLFEGPWLVQQHCVAIQRWSPHFDPMNNSLRRMILWVRIPNIPMHGYNKHFLHRLGDRIGRTVRVDMNTVQEVARADSELERGRYAKVCVELDLQQKLVPRVIFGNSIFNVEYMGIDLICFYCGRYGHRKDQCPWNNATQSPCNHKQDERNREPSTPPTPTLKTPVTGEDKFGEWMLSGKPRKSRPRRTDKRSLSQSEQGSSSRSNRKSDKPKTFSRFAALADLEEDPKAPPFDHPNTERASDSAILQENPSSYVKITGKLPSSPRSGQMSQEIVKSGNQGNPKSHNRPTGKENKIPNASNAQDSSSSKSVERNDIGPTPNSTLNSPKMARQRNHVVVEGNITQIGPPIASPKPKPSTTSNTPSTGPSPKLISNKDSI
ncbi:uncharacterized protein LOC114721522 [Neltuma alba]|uniref:uncharacterized protein LOC114721522 n=1 Tax=Neltuma alba TaxID=207710 RepID=UPI0010A4E77C|nr:uncharacterized protein LOC114721522 [Prosopis alba]